jgi:DNA helicase II / ATP-dependent DNA helicase PcrA
MTRTEAAGAPRVALPALTMTPEQAAAARAGPEGAFLVAAGPGTGKTFTIVQRFRWLVEKVRVRPDQVLAVTFTEAAAAELRERLSAELGQPLEDAWIGTFHGVCARLLREHAYLVGIAREVRVLDELGQRLFRERLQARLRSGAEPGLDRDYQVLNPDEVTDLLKSALTFALKLKGRGILPAEFQRRALEVHAAQPQQHDGLPPWATAELEAIEVLHTIYERYQRWLRDAGRMDFDDLILTVIEALRTVPEFRERCRRRFRHIVVDEFQDTNRIQLDLIDLLAAPEFSNVTVVGDAKQSIYGWRDAEIENIRSRFPGRRLPLTLNRRSRQEILDCATAFIRRDPDFEDEPDLTAERGPGGQAVSVVMAADPVREAALVASEIRRLLAAGRPPSGIAVLAHSVKQLPREFEEELRRQGVPYLTSGGSGFFDREEVKDVLALLRLVVDPMDDAALVRALQGPVVRMDDAALYRLAARRFGQRGLRLRDCLDASAAEGWPELEPALAGRLEAVLRVTDDLGQARDGLTVADVLNRLLERSGYLRHCELRARREGPRPVLNVRKLFDMASGFERDAALAGVGDFVAHLDRVIDTNLPVGEAAAEDTDAVRLLTIHGAKGLEFDAVFLVNVRPPNPRETERLFFDPYHFGFVMKWWRSDRHPRYREHLPGAGALALARQERRRAVYVALTRARDLLFVSASRSEGAPGEVDLEADDHFAEILDWALSHPEAARVVQAEQLELPGAGTEPAPGTEDEVDVEAVIARLELLRAVPDGPASRRAPPADEGALQLSFSQLHLFEVCPVRYRYELVWRVPAPPDELLARAARFGGAGAVELGSAVHRALAAWHVAGGDLLALYHGPEAGRDLLRAYLAHPLASAATYGAEVEFNLRLDGVRVRGVVDRVCRFGDRTTLVDYKTNARLDARLRHAYGRQLQLYGLAANRGLLPGGPGPRLVLFDLRHAEAIEVEPDPAGAGDWVTGAAERIRAGDFSLGPEHRTRPCFLCAYRPLCPDSRL